MVLADQPSVYLNFVNDSDKIQLTNPVSLGESWTVEAWFSLSPIARQNLRQNLLEQKLQANDPQQDVHFGNSVAISGNFAIIGANLEDTGSDYAGSAYIFERNNDGTWTEKQKLFASDAEAGNLFGTSVAISDNFAIIGANLEDTKGSNAGSAYIFERDNDSIWTEKQKLLASDAEAGDLFGTSVAISDNFAIIGANLEDTKGSNAGSAYIFERDNDGTWTEKQKLLASDAEAEDNFGNSVALNGNFALVGANGESTGGSNAGSVYIFERDSSGTWTEKQKLLASDAEAGDLFGASLAINDNFALVGANGESTGGSNAGSVYIFERDNDSTWTEKQKLLASDAEAKDCFGYSVAISDNFAFVGAYRKDAGDSNSNAGSAYIFERDNNGTWTEKQKLLASDAEAEDYFGHAVAINDNFALVGANGEDMVANNAGSAYIFTLSLPEPSRVLVASSNGDTPVVIQDESKLGTMIDGVFYDSGYDLAQLTPGWHHLAAVGKDATTQFYLDGQKIADVKQALIDAALDDASKQEIEAKICKLTGDISSIGNVINGFKQFGQLAELRIWNLARSDQEIADNSSIGLRGNESGLAAYYPLNEAEGNQVKNLTDSSNNATVTDATWEIDNKVIDPTDQAMKFDGTNDYIEVPYSATINPNQFTVSCWVKVTAGVDSYRSPITCRNNSPNRQGYKFYAGSNNKWQMWIGIGEKWQPVIGTDIVLNTWTHLAGTYDGSKLKFYIDGKLASELETNLVVNTSAPLRIAGGKTESEVDYLLPGQVAEVRIWNQVRTAEEIEWYMHQRLRGNESGLVAYYPLDEIQTEGDTQKVLDRTNNQNHGTVHGGYLVDYLDRQGIEFSDQNDYIEVPAHPNPTKAITVSLWAKSNTENWNEYGCLASKRNAYILHPWIDGKTINFFIYASGWRGVEYTPSDIKQWHHYAGTFDGKILKLYIDGVEVAKENVFSRKTAINSDQGALYIGKDDDLERYFNGQIAEVSIWNKACTAKAIQGYMHKPLKGNESGLVTYLPLNGIQLEGDRQKMLDLTTKKNHGIVHGTIQTTLLVSNLEHQGMEFDGVKDYINCGRDINLANKSFTISFWAKRHSISEKTVCIVAQTKKDPPDNNHGLLIGFRGNTNKFFLAFWGNPLDSDDSYEDTDWHYWSCTFDSTTKGQAIYRDGVFVKERTADSNSLASGDFLLGCFFRNRSYFHGALAEISIWNHAHTEAQIQGTMNQFLSGKEPGLVAYLPLNKI